MKPSRYIVLFVLTVAVVSACAADPTTPAAESSGSSDARTVAATHRGLASSSLIHAVLADLPDGVLLRCDTGEITQEELDGLVAKAPEEVRDQLRKNGFFVLEQIAAQKLVLAEARAALEKAGKEPAALPEHEMVNEYLTAATGDVEVADAEVKSFYEQNKDMVGGAPFDQIKDQIRQYMIGLGKQEAVNERIATLGKRVKIEVAANWTEQQAILAADNPVDKARSSGKPTMVDFGADGCGPCDMMTPILAALKKEYEGKVNVEFVHVRDKQILAARYGVGTIPTQVFYDAKGDEAFRHVGFFPQDEIEKKLAEMGIE